MIKNRVEKLLWETDLMATRFTLAIAAILTSFLLFNYPIFWGNFPDAYVMATLFLIQGIGMVYTVLVGWKESRFSFGMYVDSVLGCALWSYVCATNLLIDAWHYSDAAHIAIALASWWSLVRWREEDE